jgi:hypothetical protein
MERAKAQMGSGDYQQDYDDGLHGRLEGNQFTSGYAAGAAARENLDVMAGDAADRRAAALSQMAEEYRRGPLKFYVRSLAQTVVISGIIGAIAGGLAMSQGRPPLEWAIPAAGVTAGLFLIILAAWTFGLVLGYALLVLTLPLVLWRWVVSFGLLGAGLGYALTTMVIITGQTATQRAVDFGVKGALVGFAFGVLFRVVRRLRKRA